MAYFLIDGFNLMYKFSDLEEMMYASRLSDARRGLLEKLKQYVKITNARVCVVFDGKKEKSLEITRESLGTIDIYYSLEYSADYLIKQFVKKDMNPRMTTVITSDKDIIVYVSRFKAKVMTSEEFADYMNKAVEQWIESQTPEKEDNPVVSDEEISFWEKLFKGRKKAT